MVDETLVKDRERIKEELNAIGNDHDEIFMIVMQEMDKFNYFLKSRELSRDKNPNVIGAIAGIIRFLLLQPIASYDNSLRVFTLKKIRPSDELLSCFKHHLPLFHEFDMTSIPQASWIINSLTREFVQILLKVNRDTESIIGIMNIASQNAKINGWNGELQVITRSREKIILPSS